MFPGVFTDQCVAEYDDAGNGREGLRPGGDLTSGKDSAWDCLW